jgi:hypothetical protein
LIGLPPPQSRHDSRWQIGEAFNLLAMDQVADLKDNAYCKLDDATVATQDIIGPWTAAWEMARRMAAEGQFALPCQDTFVQHMKDTDRDSHCAAEYKRNVITMRLTATDITIKRNTQMLPSPKQWVFPPPDAIIGEGE